MKAPSLKFQATIYRIWMMRHVDLPEEIGHALRKESGTKKHIPVVATVNGRSVRTTLVPAGGGRYRLTLNTQLRKAAHADAGDVIGVELRLDRASREIPLPPELQETLRDHPKAWRAFETLPPGHRRQLLLFYSKAKSPGARETAAIKVIDHLLERALLAPQPRKKPAKASRRKS
jgi:hypothetical protein